MTGDNPDTEHLEESAQQQAAESAVEQDASSAAATDEPEATSSPPAAGPDFEGQLAERTADLQRLQAEYINYKRRVERDRALVRMQGKEAVLQSLLTVLDDIGRADEHGELHGGFKAVADSLHEAVRAHGLEPFGEVGDAFDPNLHEAVSHSGTSADVSVQSIDVVLRKGFRTEDRILRHAVVSVVDPADDAPAPSAPEETVGDDDTTEPQPGI